MASIPEPDLRFLPVALRLRDRRCLVVGGGIVGSRKVSLLLRTGAAVTVVAPKVTPGLALQIRAGRVGWHERVFAAADLLGAYLVVAATDDGGVNSEIVRLAETAGILVCDASSSERSQVIFGAIHQQDDTTVAVFTDGRDPARGRDARDRIARLMARTEQGETEAGE